MTILRTRERLLLQCGFAKRREMEWVITVMRSLGFVLAMLLAGFARAETVPDMYAAQVPVADQSAGELAGASRAALAEVLVKVSGSAQVLDNPTIKSALASARNQVQRYSYSKRSGASGGLEARLLFDGRYVTGLVIDAGAPIWTANRPVVLLWLVAEDTSGKQFANLDTSAELIASAREEFSRRGVPLQLPLYDLVDATALTTEQAWRLDAPALELASSRYNSQDVLAGRFARLASGGVEGEWIYLHGDERLTQPVSAENEQQFLRQGVALAAQAMAARYAVAASATGASGVSMRVSGITTYADYAALVSWLEGLELIEQADVEAVQGDTLVLRLLAQADAAQLASIIEINRNLVPLGVGAPGMPGNPGSELSYQWQQ